MQKNPDPNNEANDRVGFCRKLCIPGRMFIACGSAASVFIFLPLVVYALNLDFVDTPKMSILLWGGILTLLFGLVLGVLCVLPRVGNWVFVLCQIGLVGVVVLTAFPNRVEALTGFGIGQGLWPDLLALLKVILLLAAGIWLAFWRKAHLMWLAWCGLAIVVLISLYVVAVPVSAADNVKSAAGSRRMFTQLGTSSNVVVVIFDAFTGYRMAELFKEHAELRTAFEGFTYYPRAIASALNTQTGVSTILTGDLQTALDPATSWQERNTESVNKSFLADAGRYGRKTAFISRLETKGTNVPQADELAFMGPFTKGLMTRLPSYLGACAAALTRILPSRPCRLFDKCAVRVVAHNRKSAKNDIEVLESLTVKYERLPLIGKIALQHVIDHLHVRQEPGSVIVLHSDVSHSPNNIAADGCYIEDRGRGFEGTSMYVAREAARLIEKLKVLGVYETSLIIFVSDHGWMNIRDKTMGLPVDAAKGLPLEYNPLVMVKPPYARGPCRDSAMSVWLGDVATTVRDFLGVPVTNQGYTTYSLLGKDQVDRELNVPIFFHPDQSPYYGSLAEWPRREVQGTFMDYVSAAVQEPERLLDGKAKLKLFAGVDQWQAAMVKSGWADAASTPYRCSVEVNGRLLAKQTKAGMIVVAGTRNQYTTQFFEVPTDAEMYIKRLPQGQKCIIAGLHVPRDVLQRMFPDVDKTSVHQPTSGVVAVLGGTASNSKISVGSEDLNLEYDWEP